MIWPPEIVYLSAKGKDGPTFRRHRDGIVTGHRGRVCMLTLQGLTGLWGSWPVCNRHGSYNTMAMAIGLHDPFQRVLS